MYVGEECGGGLGSFVCVTGSACSELCGNLLGFGSAIAHSLFGIKCALRGVAPDGAESGSRGNGYEPIVLLGVEICGNIDTELSSWVF